MPNITDIMDVAIEDLSPEQLQQLEDATDQFHQKCLMSFEKNRSGVPYLKNEMPRVLLSGESDATTLQEKEECMQAFRDAAEDMLSRHHRAFLGVFKQMMVGVFGPGMEQVFSRVSPQGYSMEIGKSSSAQPGTQPPLQSQPVQPPPQSVGSQPIQPLSQGAGGQPVQPPLRATGGGIQSSHLHRAVQVNRFNSRTRISPPMGRWLSVSSGVSLTSTYKIAPASNRLQKNLYGGGYHEVVDYGAIDVLPNPGYGAAAGIQEDDILVQKMADMMQNQFGLKPKMQGPTYRPPFPEWYYRVILPPRVKPPRNLPSFLGRMTRA
jgi:hypothetical protein